ncbi:hypothetical protein EKH77_03700 [Streptomyces luteoverticillatus]|uniref:Uncharacterized protein n=1 Tax=Streptomyces luteoverticillatus TaxID=66425 RepID=A0A3S9PSG9_STRLT|nr:hypothetical protein EKH77_03700 [Streptomyces luteoverticillatus]
MVRRWGTGWGTGSRTRRPPSPRWPGPGSARPDRCPRPGRPRRWARRQEFPCRRPRPGRRSPRRCPRRPGPAR